jgi:hypothetical protein
VPDLASVTPDDFDALKGQRFDAHLPESEATFALTLAGVQRHPGGTGFREPFSLELLGPPSPVYPQGVYRLRHPDLGELDLFVVPIAGSEAGVTYEITFS